MATPGGTGALSNTFANYLNDGDKKCIELAIKNKKSE